MQNPSTYPPVTTTDKKVWLVMDSELHSIPREKTRLIRVNAIKSSSGWVKIVPSPYMGYETKLMDPQESGFTTFDAKLGTVGDTLVHVNAEQFKKQLYHVKHSVEKIQTFNMETVCVTKGIEERPNTDQDTSITEMINGLLG